MPEFRLGQVWRVPGSGDFTIVNSGTCSGLSIHGTLWGERRSPDGGRFLGWMSLENIARGGKLLRDSKKSDRLTPFAQFMRKLDESYPPTLSVP